MSDKRFPDKIFTNVTPINANIEIKVTKILADTVIPKQQPWFWDHVIPLDTTTLFAGFGASGKSQLLIFISAKTTTGEQFSAGGQTFQLPQGNVIILSGEDDFEYQLVPRLIAAKADLSKIHLLKMMKIPEKPDALLDLDEHLILLDRVILDLKEQNSFIKLIVIDPVQYFTGEMKDHINSNVCRFIGSLNNLAKKHNLAIIMNKHLRKKGSGDGASSAVDSVSGSGAWTTSPRACWLIHRHPTKEGMVLFVDLKGNLKASQTKCLAYKIEKTFIENPLHPENKIETTAMTWSDKLEDFNADQALNAKNLSPIQQAIQEWIIQFLLECNKNPNNEAMFNSTELGKEALANGFKRTPYFETRSRMLEQGIIKEHVIGHSKKQVMISLTDPKLYS